MNPSKLVHIRGFIQDQWGCFILPLTFPIEVRSTGMDKCPPPDPHVDMRVFDQGVLRHTFYKISLRKPCKDRYCSIYSAHERRLGVSEMSLWNYLFLVFFRFEFHAELPHKP